jgi:uncharacterized protein (DUF2345 family)
MTASPLSVMGGANGKRVYHQAGHSGNDPAFAKAKIPQLPLDNVGTARHKNNPRQSVLFFVLEVP